MGGYHVVCYFSQKLTPARRNYSVTAKELLAIVSAVAKFHLYLHARSFHLITDHSALDWPIKSKALRVASFTDWPWHWIHMHSRYLMHRVRPWWGRIHCHAWSSRNKR
jgi:hypothetical protein